MKYWLYVAFGLLLSVNLVASEYKISHLEPANWWVGMKYHRVQLMIHGPKISQLTPTIGYPGVSLVELKRVANPNYLFATIEINQDAKPGTFAIEFLINNEVKLTHSYELLPRIPKSAERQGFNSSDAIYLIAPDRFANGNPANDAIDTQLERPNRAFNGGRHGGDIAGIVKNLDYIHAMGFTQIWPMPLVENNQPNYSYHGYAATNYYLIDPRYGTNQEYKAFVAQAKAKDIGVIQDIVLNHIGHKHWWLSDLPTEDWLNPFTYNHHLRTTVQDPYASSTEKNNFVKGWFAETMPDLNHSNPLLATYLIQNTLWWIEFADLSGIREDTYGYSDEKFLSLWAKTVMEEYPNFNIVGEEWSPNPAIVAHWQRGKQNPSGHMPYMPSVMDFPIHDTLRAALVETNPRHNELTKLYEMLANDFIYPNPLNLVVFPDNHDTSRIYGAVSENLDLTKMAIVYTATMRGIPQFFYGTEVLLSSPKERDDGAVRSDMPGGWVGDAKNAFTRTGLSPRELDAQHFMKRLLNWRKNSSTIHSGKLTHYSPVDGIYTYFRYDETRTIMVILNKNPQEKTLKLERFNERLMGKPQARNVMTDTVVDLYAPLILSGYSSTILEINH